MNKPFVYIASPYTKGDSALNTRFQLEVADMCMTDGVVLPYIPLLSHFQHLVFPRAYKDWTDYDLAIIARGTFNACLRLPATCARLPEYRITESSGADGEEAVFMTLGLPVFHDKGNLYRWAASFVE